MMNMVKKQFIFVVSFMTIFSFITLASCLALMVEYDMDRLVKESTDIIEGKVVKKESHWNEKKTQIVTDVTIEVAQTLKGKTEKSITVQYPGGQITNPDGTGQGMGQSDTPRFEVNEEVFLFVQKESKEAPYKVTANFQGKYEIEKEKEGGKKFIKSAGKILAQPDTMKVREVNEFRVPLADFEATVKDVVKKQANEKSQK